MIDVAIVVQQKTAILIQKSQFESFDLFNNRSNESKSRKSAKNRYSIKNINIDLMHIE